MRTVCIENKQSSAIGGGIRFSDDNLVYTTNQEPILNLLSIHNCKRLGKEIIKINKNEIKNILKENNNIQIVNNYGYTDVLGIYKNIEQHPILSKTGMLRLFERYNISHYLPESTILPSSASSNEIVHLVQRKFHIGERVVLKHSSIDGNGNGVSILNYKGDVLHLKNQISEAFNKFSKHIDLSKRAEILIQSFIEGSSREGSITFSIQNDLIENRGLVNNIVKDGEYFGSSNFFSYLDIEEKRNIENTLYNDFLPLMKDLQLEGVRGNIGFDILINDTNGSACIYVLECNGLHRTTGSTMPNSFSYNTQNPIFIGVPLGTNKLNTNYENLQNGNLIKLADCLQSFGVSKGHPQIINIKTEGLERGHSASRISLSGSSMQELFNLFNNTGIVNDSGKKYVNEIFGKMII